MTEWLKVHAWNACVRKYREFESHPLRQLHILTQVLIAGSCTTKNRELRQVREEAAAASLFVCCRVARLFFIFFTPPLSFLSIPLYVCAGSFPIHQFPGFQVIRVLTGETNFNGDGTLFSK